MEGKEGKTEKATPKKRSDERKKGNVCVSNEVITVVTLAFGFLAIRAFAPTFYEDIRTSMISAFNFERLCDWDKMYITAWFNSSMVSIGKLLAFVLLPIMAAGVASSILQTGPLYSPEAMKLNFGKLNPVNGLKSFMSMQSAVNLVTSVLKVALVVFVAYLVFRDKVTTMIGLSSVPIYDSTVWAFKTVFLIAVKVLVAFVVVAVLDWWYRWYQHEKGMMMTKQEIRDEVKQQDVNPMVKRSLNRKMRELSLLRMMAAVPNATVVVTNPTHVAIALEYNPEKMNAPRVTAKGLRLVAQRIKRIARENNVPVIEKPELARALYKYVPVGSEIPSKFYEAVAAVLAYLHKIGMGIRNSYAK